MNGVRHVVIEGESIVRLTCTACVVDPRLHELPTRALALADTYSPHLVGLVAVVFALFLSSRSQLRDQTLYEEQIRQFDARMNDYGLGSSGANANGTMPAGGDRKDRAAGDHGEVEVQWGREKCVFSCEGCKMGTALTLAHRTGSGSLCRNRRLRSRSSARRFPT